MSIRDDILVFDDLKVIPAGHAWGRDLFFRQMSGEERDAWDTANIESSRDGAWKMLRARLLVRVLCDEAGNRLFTDGDVAALSAKRGSTLAALYDAAVKHNHLGATDAETLAKN